MTKPRTTLSLNKAQAAQPAPQRASPALWPAGQFDEDEQIFSEQLPSRVRQTNIEVMYELMNFARSGAMMQAFVMTALEKYAEQCILAGPRVFDSPMMSGQVWINAALEAKEAVRKHFDQ